MIYINLMKLIDKLKSFIDIDNFMLNNFYKFLCIFYCYNGL